MFNTTETTTTIPAFIAKLWEMVNDQKYDYLIQWCSDGTSFVIKDQNKFCSELLPIYYKHNNMASFIRQLNKYGFRKVVPVDSASLKNDRSDLEFAHSYFMRDYPALLVQIRRKNSNNKDISFNNVVAQLAQHVQQIQQKHNILESKLVSMKNENNALWREHSLLRHKHQKLQKIVNKLIQFLVTLVQQTRGLNIKRRPVPLMIKDSSKLPIQGYAAIKNHTNDFNRLNTSGAGSTSELIIPDILDESEARSILSDIAEYNSLSNTKVTSHDSFSDGSSFVAVPLQEVSPAIVYGKPTNNASIKELQGNNKKPPETVNQLSNSKIKKLNQKKQNSVNEVPLVKPVKIIMKTSTPSASTNNAPSASSSCLKPALNNKSKSKVISTLQVLSPRNYTTPQINLQEAEVDMPEIVVLSPNNVDEQGLLKNQTQFFVQDSVNSSQNIEIYDSKNDPVVDPLSDSPSLPIILSPSGTQLSPGNAVAEVAEQVENPLTANDHNLSPLQKDIETMQSDLDALKEMLQGDNFSIDASTLLGLFNADDPLSLNMPETNLAGGSGSSPMGNELVSYTTPTLVDIVDSFDDNEAGDYDEPLSVTSQTLNTPKPDFFIDSTGPPAKRKKK